MNLKAKINNILLYNDHLIKCIKNNPENTQKIFTLKRIISDSIKSAISKGV